MPNDEPRAASLPPVRRIVTTESPEGAGMVAFQDAPLQTLVFNGSAVHRLWETESVPGTVPVTLDAGATAGNAYRPGFQGTSLYVADIPAGTVGVIPMHREDSLDYIAVLAGEIHLVLETGECLLRSGDVLVQAGNLHTWENRSTEPCRLLVVVLRATRALPRREQAGG